MMQYAANASKSSVGFRLTRSYSAWNRSSMSLTTLFTVLSLCHAEPAHYGHITTESIADLTRRPGSLADTDGCPPDVRLRRRRRARTEAASLHVLLPCGGRPVGASTQDTTCGL